MDGGASADVAVHGAIAVVHGTDEGARPFLAVFAAAVMLGRDAVAGLRTLTIAAPTATLLEELLLLASLMGAGRFGLIGLSLRLRWRLLRHGRLALLRLLGILSLRGALLAGLVFAATPAAPMPLRRPETVALGGPHLWLGLGWFCRHACTSWHIVLLVRFKLRDRVHSEEVDRFPLARHASGKDGGIGGGLFFPIGSREAMRRDEARTHAIADPAKL